MKRNSYQLLKTSSTNFIRLELLFHIVEKAKSSISKKLILVFRPFSVKIGLKRNLFQKSYFYCNTNSTLFDYIRISKILLKIPLLSIIERFQSIRYFFFLTQIFLSS